MTLFDVCITVLTNGYYFLKRICTRNHVWGTLPAIIYTSESPLRHPRVFARVLVADLLASRELAWVLFWRNVRSRYRQTILGYIWIFLPPLITTLTWVFLSAAGITNLKPTDIPYPLYVLSGTLLWQGFVDALNSPLNQFNSGEAMLNKISFPREALVIAGIAEVLLNLCIRLLLLFAVFIFLRFPVPPTVVLAPLGILALLTFGTMIGLLLVPLGMLYHDIERAVVIILGLWFFITPVVYPVPTTFPFSQIVLLNPLTALLVTSREWLTTGVLSSPTQFLFTSLLSALGLFIAWIALRLALPHMIARAGSR